MFPRHALRRSQGGLFDFFPGWLGSESGQNQLMEKHSVRRAENGTDIVKAPDVVNNDRDGKPINGANGF